MLRRDTDDEIAGQPADAALVETSRDDRPTEPTPPSAACLRHAMTFDSEPPPSRP